MFQIVEKYKFPFKILLALIALSFVTFGVQSFNSTTDNYLNKVGDTQITAGEIRDLLRGTNYQVSEEDKRNVLDQLTNRALVDVGARKYQNFDLNLPVVKEMVMIDDAFLTDGKFDPERYHSIIANRYRSEKAFLEDSRSNIVYNFMNMMVRGTPILAESQAKLNADVYKVKRTIRTHTFSTDQFRSKITVNDDALKSYYEANKKDYRIPKAVKVEYVKISVEDVAKNEKVSDQEVETFMKEQEAQQAQAQAQAQAKPEGEAAKAEGDASKLEVLDEKAEAKDAKTAPKMTKEAATEMLKLQKARKLFSAVREDVSESTFNNPTDLTHVAKKYNVPLVKHDEGWIVEGEQQMDVNIPKKILDEVFGEEALQGNNSDVIDDGNEFYVFRNYEVRPESFKPFDEVKADVEKGYVKSETRKLIDAEMGSIVAKLKNGEDAGLDWTEPEDLFIEDFQARFADGDLKTIAKSFPEKGKPEFYLSETLQSDPVIIKVEDFTVDEARRSPIEGREFDRFIIDIYANELWLLYNAELLDEFPIKQGKEKLEDI